MFVLVRHAHAGDKNDWGGPDALRPLSARGLRQANGLVDSLRGLRISAVWSSPTTRCRQTVAPLANERRLPVRDHALVLPDADLTALLALLGQPATSGAVLCTHGETLTRLLPHWLHTVPTDDTASITTSKGAAWIVEDFPGPRPRLQYLSTLST